MRSPGFFTQILALKPLHHRGLLDLLRTYEIVPKKCRRLSPDTQVPKYKLYEMEVLGNTNPTK